MNTLEVSRMTAEHRAELVANTELSQLMHCQREPVLDSDLSPVATEHWFAGVHHVVIG